MSNFNGFTEDHIGEVVTDISGGCVGTIISLDPSSLYQVKVYFKTGNRYFTCLGYAFEDDLSRSLYFGSKIKFEVAGEVIPEKKLICPVCGVEHEIYENVFKRFNFKGADSHCPFQYAGHETKAQAEGAMKNLIKAMETKKK